LRANAKADAGRINDIESRVKHDVIAFTMAVGESVGDPLAARWLHYGMTSNDVVDTAQALQIRDAAQIIERDLVIFGEILDLRAHEFRRTPQIGRTHGIHAEPITFGLKIANWFAENQRNIGRLRDAAAQMAIGKISGAVGNASHLGPDIEARICKRLGLNVAPVASQVIQRDRHAQFVSTLALIAATLEKISTEIRHLQRTEVREVEEPFGGEQRGSSAMPHKRNPVSCEQISGLARVVRSNMVAAYENVALWHERDISHSSVERVILPDSFIALDHMLRRMIRIVRGMAVDAGRMRENLNRSRGVVFSGTVLLELAKKGISREEAYAWVQRNAMRSFDEHRDFKALLLADPDITRVLSTAEIERAFDLDEQLKHVDQIFDRVFHSVRA
jgi:adenylosuccinate lyase